MEMREAIKRAWRTIHIAKKPNEKEFYKVAKITGAGMIFIGFVGLIISLLLKAIQ